MLNEVMAFSLEGLDLKKGSKELKPTSKCFKDYISSLKNRKLLTGNRERVQMPFLFYFIGVAKKGFEKNEGLSLKPSPLLPHNQLAP